MSRLQIVVLGVLCISLSSGCVVMRHRAPPTVEPTTMPTEKQPTISRVPFIAADVAHTFEPFQYLQGLSDAHISFFGAEKLFWHAFEPDEFLGYQWDEYDAVIHEVESVGGDVLPTIWSISTWATEVPSAENPSSAPKPEYRQRYASFVQAIMERYDHDGVDDMPGLLYAHNYLQIEDEAENLGDSWISSVACDAYRRRTDAHFRCAANEYGEMLKLAYQAAHTANPDAKVVSFSFNFGDYFDANPASFPSIPPDEHRLAFLDEVFAKYSDYFDVIAVQCNYDYPGIPPMVNYVRDTYKLGKPIVCADAASMPMVVQRQSQPRDRYEDKYPFLKDSEILAILDKGPTNPRHAEIKSWWEAEKARVSVKKAVVAASAGVEQIGFQFVMTGGGGQQNPWRHSELLSAGPKYGSAEPVGTPRPVVYALGQLGEKVVNLSSVQDLNPIPPGTDPRGWLWMYLFDNKGEVVYVLWSGSGESTVDLSSYISTATVKTTHIVTTLDENDVPIYPSEVIIPTASVSVNETPLFVEPAD